MKSLTLYQVFKWDGGDRHYHTHVFFETKEAADAWLKDNKYDDYQKTTLEIYESYSDYTAGKTQQAIVKALNKLTLEEQQLLGLI